MKNKLYFLSVLALVGTFTSSFFVSASEVALSKPISCSDWAYENVVKAESYGIISDVDANFKEAVSGKAFCEMIYKFVSSFCGEYADEEDEITYLCKLCVIEEEFSEKDVVTREEAAVVLINAVNAVNPVAVTQRLYTYSDSNEISDYAVGAVQAVSNLGFMGETENGCFAPHAALTAEQAATIIVRAFENVIVSASDVDYDSAIGIIGGADGPTQIIVGSSTIVIDKNDDLKITKEKDIDEFYLNEAVGLFEEVVKCASDDVFAKIYTSDPSVLSKISEIEAYAGKKPEAIYYLSIDFSELSKKIKELNDDENDDVAILENMLEYKRKLNLSIIPNMVNGSYGPDNLVVTTILTNSCGYVMPQDFKNDFALFLQFDGEYSAFVDFCEFGEGVIKATVQLIKNGENDSIFLRMKEIEEALGEECVEIAAVNVNS